MVIAAPCTTTVNHNCSGRIDNSIVGNSPHITWTYVVLPYLDQAGAYNNLTFEGLPVYAWLSGTLFDGNARILEQGFSFYHCPSDSGPERKNVTSLVGLTSIGRNPLIVATLNYGGNCGLHVMDEENSLTGMFCTNSSIDFADITDGASNTMLLAENLKGGSADGRGLFTHRGPTSASVYFTQPPNSTIADRMNTGGCPTVPVRNQPCQTMAKNHPFDDWYAAARSSHTGGVQVALADGSTHFISENISQEVWQNLGARNDGNVIGEF